LDHFVGLSFFFAILAGALWAVLTFRAFGVMHDCVHGAGHQKSWINRWAGEVYGIACFLPYTSWRKLHLDHHHWTGNVEKDPSMKILTRFRDAGGKLPAWVKVSWRWWAPALASIQHLVFWKATVSSREYFFLFGLVLYLGILVAVLSPWTLVCGAVFYLMMVEVINFPHHLAVRQYDGETRFPVYEQDPFVRTCVYPKWFAHYALLNFNLHVAHHAFPAHPWYQLDELHSALSKTGEKFNVDRGNRWIVENRKLPLERVFQKTFRSDDETSPLKN
jgi:fatty acid desaturase